MRQGEGVLLTVIILPPTDKFSVGGNFAFYAVYLIFPPFFDGFHHKIQIFKNRNYRLRLLNDR